MSYRDGGLIELLPVTLEGMLIRQNLDSPEEILRMATMIMNEVQESKRMFPCASWASYGPIYRWGRQVELCCDMLTDTSAWGDPHHWQIEADDLCNTCAEIDVEEMQKDGFTDLANGIETVTKVIAMM
jgi:hypothetical protein